MALWQKCRLRATKAQITATHFLRLRRKFSVSADLAAPPHPALSNLLKYSSESGAPGRNSPARFREKFQCDGWHCPADSSPSPLLPQRPTPTSSSPSYTGGTSERPWSPCLPWRAWRLCVSRGPPARRISSNQETTSFSLASKIKTHYLNPHRAGPRFSFTWVTATGHAWFDIRDRAMIRYQIERISVSSLRFTSGKRRPGPFFFRWRDLPK